MKVKIKGRLIKADIIFFIFFSFLYFIFLSKFYLWDALSYAKAIEERQFSSIWFVNPHHLIYATLGYVFFRTTQCLGAALNALSCLQVMNAAFGVLGILIFYSFMRNFLKKEVSAIFSTLILGFSYGYWYLAISGEPYAGSNFFLILSFFLIYYFSENPSFRKGLLLGISCALAILFNQVNILLLVILFLTFLISQRVNRLRLRHLIFVVFISILFAGTIYLFFMFYILKLNNPLAMLRWLMGYGKNFFYFELDNLLKACYGLYRAIFGGYFIKRILLGEWNIYIMLISILYILTNIAFLFFMYPGVRFIKMILAHNRTCSILIFSWVTVYFLFFTFYEPGNFKFYVTNLIPLAAFSGMVFDNFLPQRRNFLTFIKKGIILSLPVFLFGAIFFGSIFYQSRLENNEEYMYAKFIYDNTTREDLIIFPGVEFNIHLYLDYFGKEKRNIKLIQYAMRNPAELNEDIRSYLLGGKNVYLVSENRLVSSGNIIRSFAKLSDYYSATGKVMADFLDEYNYRLIEKDVYKGRNAYEGNPIFKIVRINE